MKIGKRTKFATGILLSGLFLWLAVRKADLGRVFHEIVHINILYFLAALAVILLFYELKVLRWRLILRPLAKVSQSQGRAAMYVCYFVNSVLPGKLGEVSRSQIVGTDFKLSRLSVFSTVLVEKLFDLVTIFMIVFVIFFFKGVPHALVRYKSTVSIASVLIILFFAILITLFILRERLTRYVEKKMAQHGGKRPPLIYLVDRIAAIAKAAQFIGKPGLMLGILLLSILIWIEEALGAYCLFRAFDIHLPAWTTLFLIVITNLGISIPASPGDIGTFQFFAVTALTAYGIDSSRAVSFAFVFHFTQLLPSLAIGNYFMMKRHLSVHEIEEKAGESDRMDLDEG